MKQTINATQLKDLTDRAWEESARLAKVADKTGYKEDSEEFFKAHEKAIRVTHVYHAVAGI